MDPEPLRKMTPQEFRDEGYLLEVNRRFFHPLGLAMFVDLDEDTTEPFGIYDDRKDLEGWRFADLDEGDLDGAKKVEEEEDKRYPIRFTALGYWIQPITAGEVFGDSECES